MSRDEHVDALADAAFRHPGAVHAAFNDAGATFGDCFAAAYSHSQSAGLDPSSGWTAQSCRNQGTANLLSEAS